MIWLLACSEYTVRDSPEVPVADPPGAADDGYGAPPDWADCTVGYAGTYYNLTASHPDIEPGEDERPADTYEALDWWDDDYFAFSRFDASLDQGSNWWPVDEGLIDDPAYFSARWVAWMRVWEDGEVRLTAGSSDDLWVSLSDGIVLALPGVQDFEPETYTIELAAGQYPMEVRYAHRSGASGLRLRVLDGVSICYPDFSEDTATP